MDFIQFNNGQLMPILGLGCGLLQTKDENDLTGILDKALELGYRHFDTAYMYENEHILGRVFKKWIDSGKITRQDLFITSKLPCNGNRPEHVRHFLEQSLADLQVDYVDLYLIHNPISYQWVSDRAYIPKGPDGFGLLDMSSDLHALWSAMEKQVEDGLTKSIGLSNVSASQVRRISEFPSTRILPANVQVEFHLYFQQKELHAVCKEFNISICAYGPLGSLRRETTPLFMNRFTSPNVLQDTTVIELAKKYTKTPAQILLRHLIQLKVAPLVTTRTLDRLMENFQVFDFELQKSEMETLNNLDKGEAGRSFRSSIHPPGAEKHHEFPFPPKPIEADAVTPFNS